MASFATSVLFVGLVIVPNFNNYVESFHFDLKKQDKAICFLEELEEGITVRGSYNVTYHGKNVAETDIRQMNLEVSGPDRKHLIVKDYTGIGTFAFSIEDSGMHEMCFGRQRHSKAEFVRIQIHYEEVFPDDSGQMKHDEEDERREREEQEEKKQKRTEGKEKDKKEKDDEKEDDDEKNPENEREGGGSFKTEKAVRHLIDIYHNIEERLKQSMKREKRFRDLSKTTNSRVVLWAFLQLLVLAATALWQMRHLTKFFILKKLA